MCNGAPGGGGGGGEAVTVWDEPSVTSSDTAVTLQSATITTTGAGHVIAVGSADAFCSASGPPTCGAPPTDFHFRITDSASADPTVDENRGYGFLEPDVTSSVTRTGIFAVAGAGSHSYYVRARAAFGGGSVGFWRRQLSLVFVPD